MALSSVTRALVVGGTSGIGYGIACRIAAEATSATVIISGRTKPKDIPHANIEFRQLDASSMRSIKTYTDTFKAAQEPQLDLLVLTQGIMTTTGRKETSEGIDRKMALHYYGRQLIIRELSPVLTNNAKVLLVYDSVAGSPAKMNWDDMDLKTTFSLKGAADHCTSMTDAMIEQYSVEQNEQQTGHRRHFVHAQPGVVKTSLMREMPWYLRGPAAGLAQFIGTSPDVCARNLLKGTYDRAEADGKAGRYYSYINSKGLAVPNKTTWTQEQRQKVVDHTWKLIDGAIETGN